MSSRRRDLAVVTNAAVALAALPVASFAPVWLLALTLPALVLLALRRVRALGPLDAVAMAALVQLAAILGADALAGPLEQRAAIGATLLPPLVYLSLRGEDLDAPRSVFLAFCVFVIGSILGDPSSAHVLLFVATSACALQADALAVGDRRRASWRGPRARPAARLLTASTVVVASLLAFLVSLELLRLVPSPDIRGAAAAQPRTTVGVSNEFDLDGPAGELLQLREDELVRVRSGDRRALPSDLYLRCGYFDVAELDRWRTAPQRHGVPPGEFWRIRQPHPALPERSVQVELLLPESRMAFVPAGTFRLEVPAGLVGNRLLESFEFREDEPLPGRVYLAQFQALQHLETDALPWSGAGPELTKLPDSILRRRAMFEEILAAPEVQGRLTPLELAQGIAQALQARCRYELREPSGPYDHSLLNFLDGDRHGFCMHFASATAVCLRLEGVPCRVGVGLYGGDSDLEEWGALSFGSRHGHAWVEIPFHGLGWVVFDPTPPAERTRPTWPQGNFTDSIGDAGDDEAAGRELVPENGVALAFGRELWPWALLALLLGAPLLVAFRPKQTRHSAPRGDERAIAAARRLLERVLAQLDDEGWPRQPGEGLLHYAERLRHEGASDALVDDAFAAYHEVRFGGRAFDDSHRERLSRATAPKASRVGG